MKIVLFWIVIILNLFSVNFSLAGDDYESYIAQLPLNQAIQGSHFERVKILVEKGIDRTEKANALYQAIVWGRLEIVKYLIVEKKTDVNTPYRYKLGGDRYRCCSFPLIEAVWQGHLEIAQFLIDQGADVNARNAEGETALHQTVKVYRRYSGLNPYVKMVELLLEKGANTEFQNKYTKRTPLNELIFHNKFGLGISMLEALIDAGADVNTIDVDGWTPLDRAIQAGSLNTVKYLVAAGAVLSQKDGFEDTYLYGAVKNRNMKWIQFFVESGVYTDLEDMEKDFLLALAKKSGDEAMYEYLKERANFSIWSVIKRFIFW